MKVKVVVSIGKLNDSLFLTINCKVGEIVDFFIRCPVFPGLTIEFTMNCQPEKKRNWIYTVQATFFWIWQKWYVVNYKTWLLDGFDFWFLQNNPRNSVIKLSTLFIIFPHIHPSHAPAVQVIWRVLIGVLIRQPNSYGLWLDMAKVKRSGSTSRWSFWVEVEVGSL